MYADGEVFSSFNLMTEDADYNGYGITLYAQWEKEDYSITYKNMECYNYSLTDTYTIDGLKLQTPSLPGYAFEGWYLDKAFKKPITEIAPGTTGDITIYAKWTPVTAK